MRKIILLLLVILSTVGLAIFLVLLVRPAMLSPGVPQKLRPLEKYAFSRLQRVSFPDGEIVLGRTVVDHDTFVTKEFSYQSWGKKITGVANIPKGGAGYKVQKAQSKKYPVIVMIRGYVDAQSYSPGVGTARLAEFFAKNGFVTLAPDFLGYGGSDPTYKDALETRFDAPVEVLNLMASIPSLSVADPTRVGIWAHSNGGQIALSVLEISQKPYPSTLWAPVSKPFPENILAFSLEMPDRGEYLRKIVGDFERMYDPRLYSATDFLRWINAPLQLQQGVADEDVPVEWSNELVARMASLDKAVNYYMYPGENHNFNKGSWQVAVARDLAFFQKWLKVKSRG